MRRLAAIFVALMVALAVQPFVAVSPAVAAPRDGAIFNKPAPWGKDAGRYKIVRAIESAINGARPTASDPDPVVQISTYFLDRNSAADALIRACQRGVSVRVILDSGIKDRPAKRVIAALNGDNVTDNNRDGVPDRPPSAGPCNRKLPAGSARAGAADPLDPSMSPAEAADSVDEDYARAVTWGSDGSFVKRCFGSCRGGRGAMHSKFFLFSSSGGVRDVTMVSSSNLNAGGALKGWNDMVTFTNRGELRRAFARVHREMTVDDYNVGLREVVDGNVTARFFPRRGAGKANDPTLQDLNRISCTSDYGPTQVRVSMFYWAFSRGLYLADKLTALGRAGCKVSVTYGAPGKDVRAKLLLAAKRGVITLYDSRKFPLKGGDYKVRTHGKYMLVRGTFAGNRKANLVVTGSQNWTNAALVGGDEVTVSVMNAGVYHSYLKNYDVVRRHSVKVPKR